VSLIACQSWSQDLLTERIRKVNTVKKNVYFDGGIFHNGNKKIDATLKSLRHSFKEQEGYERLVVDFGTTEAPRVYANLNNLEKKLFIDFFSTKVQTGVGSFGTSKYVKSVNFFPISEQSLSTEIEFKDNVSIEIFELKNPGRIVIDLKKI